MNRITKVQMFLDIAEIVAKRGTCPRAQVGAVIVRDGRIISMGYNGAAPGISHCSDIGCDVPEASLGCQRAIHAECNAIAFAARYGLPTDSSQMYCTHGACLTCAKIIVAAGISEFIYRVPYRITEGIRFLEANGVIASP